MASSVIHEQFRERREATVDKFLLRQCLFFSHRNCTRNCMHEALPQWKLMRIGTLALCCSPNLINSHALSSTGSWEQIRFSLRVSLSPVNSNQLSCKILLLNSNQLSRKLSLLNSHQLSYKLSLLNSHQLSCKLSLLNSHQLSRKLSLLNSHQL